MPCQEAICVLVQMIKIGVFFATLALPHSGFGGPVAEPQRPVAAIQALERPLSNPRRR